MGRELHLTFVGFLQYEHSFTLQITITDFVAETLVLIVTWRKECTFYDEWSGDKGGRKYLLAGYLLLLAATQKSVGLHDVFSTPLSPEEKLSPINRNISFLTFLVQTMMVKHFSRRLGLPSHRGKLITIPWYIQSDRLPALLTIDRDVSFDFDRLIKLMIFIHFFLLPHPVWAILSSSSTSLKRSFIFFLSTFCTFFLQTFPCFVFLSFWTSISG